MADEINVGQNIATGRALVELYRGFLAIEPIMRDYQTAKDFLAGVADEKTKLENEIAKLQAVKSAAAIEADTARQKLRDFTDDLARQRAELEKDHANFKTEQAAEKVKIEIDLRQTKDAAAALGDELDAVNKEKQDRNRELERAYEKFRKDHGLV
jgi:chromosome segregation ATPase